MTEEQAERIAVSLETLARLVGLAMIHALHEDPSSELFGAYAKSLQSIIYNLNAVTMQKENAQYVNPTAAAQRRPANRSSDECANSAAEAEIHRSPLEPHGRPWADEAANRRGDHRH